MTERIDLGALAYDQGFFLVRRRRSTEPEVPEHASRRRRSWEPFVSARERFDGTFRHVFTYPDSPRTIKEAALELVREARSKIFVASFLLGEPELLDALFAAAERLCGGVYVVSELSDRSLRQRLAELEDVADPDAAAQIHKKNFAELTRHGIAVRGRPDCHAKFIVADDRAALVSSANLDTNGLNNIGENGVLTTDLTEVDRIARFFARLWEGCEFEMPAGSAEYSVRERAATNALFRVDTNPGTGIIWTHNDERVILEHFHDIIGRARRDLLLATYSLNDLADHPDLLIKPLEQAIDQHHLQVRLLCRGRNNVPSQRRDASLLTDLGVSVHADSVNHAKGAIADRRHGALFSANFDAAHGLLNGVETGVRLDGEPMLAEAARFFEHAMINGDLEFARRPTQRDMNGRLAAGWCVPWPGSSQLRVRAADGVWHGFRSAAEEPPVLYVKEGDRIHLYAGKSQWSLSTREGRWRLEAAGSTGKAASELLETWLSTRRREGPTRGFCPAVLERE